MSNPFDIPPAPTQSPVEPPEPITPPRVPGESADAPEPDPDNPTPAPTQGPVP